MALAVALTADDAPTIGAGPGAVRADPARLDRLRGVLAGHGVPHCVAFVIGEAALGHEAALERWLAAGYELGNHTHDHARASRTDASAWLGSVRRCDALLARVGAFDAGRRRWFRYPFLDRGRDAAARAEIAHALSDLGYTAVHATVDFFDHCYEAPWAEAMDAGDRRRAEAVGRRYERTALGSLRRAERIARRAADGAIVDRVADGAIVDRAADGAMVHLAYFHFGGVSEGGLSGVLERCREAGVAWRTVEEAVTGSLHRAYDGDPRRSGLVTGDLPRGVWDRVVSRLARLADAVDPRARRLGPAFPHRA